MNYNLLDEQWIPVLYRNGEWKRVGIRRALEEAGKIRQIAASNPMDRVAILRFLLALLYWCRGSPPADMNAAPSDSFPAGWFSKLDDNKDCFNLLGEGKRFYQNRTARRHAAVTNLIQEIPSGHNFWHFRHSEDEKTELCLACCAMGLLRLPLFSVSGLSGPGQLNLFAGINGVPPVYVIPVGKSLMETLQVSFLPNRDLGQPAWIQPIYTPDPDQDVPLLTGMTILSRRIWLHNPVARAGSCIGCGNSAIPMIHTCEFETAGKLESDRWNDPHVVYLDKKPRRSIRASNLTDSGKFKMDRPWPELLARLAETGKILSNPKIASLFVVGFASSKAKNIDVWERTIEVRSLNSIKGNPAAVIRQWQKEGTQLEKRISRSKVEGAAFITAIRPHVEHQVSAKADEFIAGAGDAWKKATEEYRPMMGVIAKSLSPGFTAAAVQTRRRITGVTPYMRQKIEAAKKSEHKKGGNK